MTHDVFAYISKFYDVDDDTLDSLTMSYDAAKRVLRNRGFFDATLLIEAILKQKQLRDDKTSSETTKTTTSDSHPSGGLVCKNERILIFITSACYMRLYAARTKKYTAREKQQPFGHAPRQVDCKL